MTKFKRWLYQKFLPAYCKDGVLEENEKLAELVRKQRQEIEVLQAHIDGMERVLRRGVWKH